MHRSTDLFFRPAAALLRRAAALALPVLLATSGVLAAPAREAGPTVRTAAGALRGTAQSGLYTFRGIPYAKPPVGDLRWRAPVPFPRWTGTRAATTEGETCAQLYGLGVFAGPPSFNEDCLTLNVVTPTLAPAAGAALPVIVWFHGGGLFDGDARDYDGSALARAQAVIVTVNYRLGMLGFLAHPGLRQDGTALANFGFADQQLALRWVQDNIAAFGGDATRVAIGGQSSGSASVIAQVVSPLAKGLFSRAIYQSGWSDHPWFFYTSLQAADEQGLGFAKAAGCEQTDAAAAACLRRLSVEQIMTLQGTPTAVGPYMNPGTGVVDGVLITEEPHAAFANGHFNHVPMMNGLTRDENSFFVMIPEYHTGRTMSAAEHEAAVRQMFPAPAYAAGTADKALAQYPLTAFKTPSEANVVLGTDIIHCAVPSANATFERQVPLYAYEFSDRTAPSYFPPLAFDPGAYHTADILYTFPGFHGGNLGRRVQLNAAQQQLSKEMIRYWVNFARTGNPNGRGDAPWPRYTAAQRVYLSQDLGGPATLTEAEFRARHKCNFWSSVAPAAP